ncbi:MAG: protein with domain of unknown function DUF4168 [Idiomarinaceae bacterium HL-53]|nr:MAG: protein with domain of unknown function DUF4168 [Idiomarinaceae bacterium HL-53]CUS47859.1 protein of unknown function (DUF4168) [Idiomarinaceae bacterium HL-53]
MKRTMIASLMAAMFATAPALAQQSEADQQAAAQAQMEQMANAEITDEHIEKFVVALDEIETINESFVAQLESVESQEEAQQLQIEAQREMVSAVEEAGLSVEEYNTVAYRMQSDPEIRDAVEAEREEQESDS